MKLIDQYMTEHHLESKITSEKKKFNAKDGVYYKEVVFKDEPDKTYVIQPMGTSRGLFAQAFDTQTKKHLKKQNIISLMTIISSNNWLSMLE